MQHYMLGENSPQSHTVKIPKSCIYRYLSVHDLIHYHHRNVL